MQKSTEETGLDLKKNGARLLLGLAIAFLGTLAAFLIFAAVLYFGSLREKWITPTVTVIALLCVFFGGRYSTRNLVKHHFRQGAFLGFLYYLILYICALSCFSEFNFSWRTVVFVLIGALTGGIGGLSIQNKPEKKSRKRKKKR